MAASSLQRLNKPLAPMPSPNTRVRGKPSQHGRISCTVHPPLSADPVCASNQSVSGAALVMGSKSIPTWGGEKEQEGGREVEGRGIDR